MKLIFSNRSVFETSLHHIFDHIEIRGSSTGTMNIQYSDMIIEFSDESHGLRAAIALKKRLSLTSNDMIEEF